MMRGSMSSSCILRVCSEVLSQVADRILANITTNLDQASRQCWNDKSHEVLAQRLGVLLKPYELLTLDVLQFLDLFFFGSQLLGLSKFCFLVLFTGDSLLTSSTFFTISQFLRSRPRRW